MNTLVIVLRLVHILSGVFWVGSSVILSFYIGPAVAATAESGQKVLAHLITRAKIHVRITVAALLTLLAGGALYWIDSQGFTSAWQHSGPGVGFGLGALLALFGLGFGMMVGKNLSLLGNLAAQLQGKPSPDQLAKIQAAQKQLAYASPISTTALILALVCMATARYWLF